MPVLLHRVRRHLTCRTAVVLGDRDSKVEEDQEEVLVEVQEAMVVEEVRVMVEPVVEPVLEVEIQREPAAEVLAAVVVVDHPEADLVREDLVVEAPVAKEVAAEQRDARSPHPRRATSAMEKVAMESEMVVESQWRQSRRQSPKERRQHRNCGTRSTARRMPQTKSRSD